MVTRPLWIDSITYFPIKSQTYRGVSFEWLYLITYRIRCGKKWSVYLSRDTNNISIKIDIFCVGNIQPAGTGNANAQHTVAEKTLSIDGTESRMMIQFCVRHNCTLEISLGKRKIQKVK